MPFDSGVTRLSTLQFPCSPAFSQLLCYSCVIFLSLRALRGHLFELSGLSSSPFSRSRKKPSFGEDSPPCDTGEVTVALLQTGPSTRCSGALGWDFADSSCLTTAELFCWTLQRGALGGRPSGEGEGTCCCLWFWVYLLFVCQLYLRDDCMLCKFKV